MPCTSEPRATEGRRYARAAIPAGSGSEALELAATIAYCHHERFDGTGYPRGLRGTAIPLEARIVAIADSFDALTSDRVYRAAMTVDDAVDVMRAEVGHFDPDVLDVFVARLDDVHALWATFQHPHAVRAMSQSR